VNKPKWALAIDLLPASIEFMRPLGAQGSEGLALWFGTMDAQHIATVSHVVRPHGPGFLTSPLYLRLSMRAIGQLTDFADRSGLFLVGQIHSHPGTFVDLSDIDIRQGFRVQNFLSVVCPHYAQYPSTSWGECGVHVFDEGRYRRLAPSEVASRVYESATPVIRVDLEVQDD
jgi:hypothetical protein